VPEKIRKSKDPKEKFDWLYGEIEKILDK